MKTRTLLVVALLALLGGCCGKDGVDFSTPYFDLDIGGERDRRAKYQRPAPVKDSALPDTVCPDPIASAPS